MLVRSAIKMGWNRLETGVICQTADFIEILTTIMAKPAMHVETIMFMLHMVKKYYHMAQKL